MNNARKLGRVLLLSTLTSTPNLMESVSSSIEREEDDFDTVFSVLSDAQLYSRLLTDINFSKLTEEQKNAFLMLKPEMNGEVDKENLYANEMRDFVQEAHNRTSKALGVKPTKVIVCNFAENPLMDPWAFSSYSVENGNIYINSQANYSEVRPSFLLESINARTYQHFTFQNLAKAVTNPDKLNDVNFYLALTSAVKTYVYQENSEPQTDGNYLIDDDGYTLSSIAAQIYAFEKTRQDLQSAGIYGLHLRDGLREAEEDFHRDLQNYIGNDSLLNSEDMFAFYKGSSLNSSSNGYLGSILNKMDSLYSSTFYNLIGATMESGTSVKEYLDQLEEDVFNEYGLTPPTDEELAELMAIEEAQREFYREQQELGLFPEEDNEENDDSFLQDNSLEEDEEYNDGKQNDRGDEQKINYKPFKSVLGQEGNVDLITSLPFHPNQDACMFEQ